MLKFVLGPRKKWWYMLTTALFLPYLLAAMCYQIALLFPGTIKQTWFDNFAVAMLLATPLLVLYVLTRAKSYPSLRILVGLVAVIFFMLVVVSTRLSMPCGELPEYIGPDSVETSDGECT
jgi:predicted neutral ceramidase superfamily lipid hydrolase